MIPASVLDAIRSHPLPLFVYDSTAAGDRAKVAVSLVDDYFYPIKACVEPEIVRAMAGAGVGLDLCSAGDIDLAEGSGCPAARWSFTSPHSDETTLRRLLHAGAVFDADSVEQARRWRAIGGRECGLRVATADAGSPYGIKFGIPAREIAASVHALTSEGLRVVGLHLHESHAARAPAEMADRIAVVLGEVAGNVLSACEYVNIGGGWPMTDGQPLPADDLRPALATLRATLASLGFSRTLAAEPGEWVVASSGYWAARISAVKRHPLDTTRRVVILDTATPVPCRPSAAPIVQLRDGQVVHEPATGPCDLFGSANTGTDTIAVGVEMSPLMPGDVIVSLSQGAYTATLISSFNQRSTPPSRVMRHHSHE